MDSFGKLSQVLVEAALVAYAASLVAYAAQILVLGQRRPAPAAARERVLVGSGAPVGSSSDGSVGDAPGSVWSARAERFGAYGLTLLTVGFCFHLGTVVARGIAAGRVPWGNMYEFTTMGSLAAVAVFLIVQRWRDVGFLGPFVGMVTLLALGLAVTVFYTEPGPLVPALRSTWLVIHVLAAITATGLFTVGAAAAALHLLVVRREQRIAAGIAPGRFDAYLERLPASPVLERVAFRINAVGFPVWTFAVTAGAIWAQYAWARYWGWDPKETWAFITWVVYACYLHARVTAGWRGRVASVLALVAYATLIFNFIGVNMLFTGLHSYAGI
jgi:cytochrome c-type biogenesis protein CcsB